MLVTLLLLLDYIPQAKEEVTAPDCGASGKSVAPEVTGFGISTSSVVVAMTLLHLFCCLLYPLFRRNPWVTLFSAKDNYMSICGASYVSWVGSIRSGKVFRLWFLMCCVRFGFLGSELHVMGVVTLNLCRVVIECWLCLLSIKVGFRDHVHLCGDEFLVTRNLTQRCLNVAEVS